MSIVSRPFKNQDPVGRTLTLKFAKPWKISGMIRMDTGRNVANANLHESRVTRTIFRSSFKAANAYARSLDMTCTLRESGSIKSVAIAYELDLLMTMSSLDMKFNLFPTYRQIGLDGYNFYITKRQEIASKMTKMDQKALQTYLQWLKFATQCHRYANRAYTDLRLNIPLQQEHTDIILSGATL